MKTNTENKPQSTEDPFEVWWRNEGSQSPAHGVDHEEHTKSMCRIAWSNASYLSVSGMDKDGMTAPSFRRNDHDTSKAAALDASRFAKGNRLKVLLTMAKYGGLTDYDLSYMLDLQQNSIGKRRGECYQFGFVRKKVEFGEVCKVKAPSGSMATVWELTEKGAAHLERLKREGIDA